MSASEHKNPLQRDGSSQQGRNLPALDPAYVQLDDRTAEDFVHYASQLAGELNFYGIDGKPAGDWRNFLAEIRNVPEADWDKVANRKPHLALFLAFLKLFRHSQKHLNDLPRRHLDYFYKTVLRLQPKPEEPDHVHVLFELNKRIVEQKIAKGTRLVAGKDAGGKPLVYQTDDEIILNQAKVTQLRSVYNDAGQLRSALFTDTADGWGEAFETPDSKWPAFGHAGLPKVDTGIALASHMLLLTEGERWVTLAFRLSGAVGRNGSFNEASFLQNLEISASGEKRWLGPFAECKPVADGQPVFRTIENGYELCFRFKIPAGEEPVVPYNEAVLKERFNTASPMVKILFRQPAKQALVGYRLDSVKISVAVSGMKDLALENDFGTLDPAKPFQPFGPQPKKGNSFYVGSEEVFTKNYTDVKLKVKWQNLPSEGFDKRYEHYLGSNQVNTNFRADITVRGDGQWKPQAGGVVLFPPKGQEGTVWVIPQTGDQLLRASSFLLFKPVLFQQKNVKPVLFAKSQAIKRMDLPQTLQLKTPFLFSKLSAGIVGKKILSEALREGFLRLSLLQNFGHEEYIRQSVEVATFNADPNNASKRKIVPSLPYTPQVERMTLDYTAETSYEALASPPLDTEDARLNSERQFLQREIQLFHIEPFGHSEQHGYLKRHLPFLPSSDVTLLPTYPNAGEFYIGIENAEPLRTINLLFQLAEGSADPEAAIQNVSWSVLSQNHWRPLTNEHLLADHTDHFLKTGIVRVYLPKQTSTSNTLLDDKLVWLRVTVPDDVKAVCQVVGVHTQAVRASWFNEGNTGEHLETSLQALSIKKMETEIGAVKKIEQPYASFGGRRAEQPAQFYVRSAERLRHKNRAVTIWDYEHLVLEQFPSVYKAKCLNHTGPGGEFVPGEVTIVLVPQLRNQNAVDPLQPRFSSGFLRDVEGYLKQFGSKFVKIYADNADFEEIKLATSVKFRQGFEAGFYAAQFNRDLVRHLTPWAFEEGSELQFGGSILLSRMIAFAEQLEYVDYLESFSFHKVLDNGNISENQHEISANTSRSVLVSAKQHHIISI